MKNPFKLILMASAAVLATSVAQANTWTDTATLSDVKQSFTVTTTVTESAGVYTYTYVAALPVPSTKALGLDSFTVFADDVLGAITAVTLPATGWTSTVNPDPYDNVSWDSTGSHIINIPLTFQFTSPDAPEFGYAGALDGGTYNETSGSVLVPMAVPDGGLTVALLGGALAAMTLIRRRVAS